MEKKQKQENKMSQHMEKSIVTEYKCPICKNIHKQKEICPIVYKKMKKSKFGK